MSRLLVDPIDLHLEITRRGLEVAGLDSPLPDIGEPAPAPTGTGAMMANPLAPAGAPINLEWLRFAAREYQISPDIKDYLLVPVIIVPVGFPNRNGMGFNLQDLASFSPEHGQQYYKTWTGKPTFYEHANTDHTKAHGAILDVFMRKSSQGDYHKLLTYLAFDRSKYVEQARRIASKDLCNYSMGAMVTGGYTCSICERRYGTCTHISKSTPHYIGVHEQAGVKSLAYRVARKPIGFETSAVEVPAWSIANNPNSHLIDPRAEYIG